MNDDINTKRTELANQMAAAGAAVLEFNCTACAIAAIPDTEPQRYVAAGTPENIAAILPATICPQRRMRHGERPSADDLEWGDAATSGDAPTDELAAMEARKDAAYYERNQVVAALAKCFPSGVARTAIEGWSEDWHGCVYIDLPTGQASWHFHDSQAHLFDGLPPYSGKWDGHTTEEKYERLARIERAAAPAPTEQQRMDAHTTSYNQGYRAGIEMGRAMAADEGAARPATASGDELPLPDECIVHIYPSDLKRMEHNETTSVVFSVAVGNGREESVPLVTLKQARAAVSAATKPTADMAETLKLIANMQDDDWPPQGAGADELAKHWFAAYSRQSDLARSLLATKPAPLDLNQKVAEAAAAVRTAIHDITGPGFQVRLSELDIASVISGAIGDVHVLATKPAAAQADWREIAAQACYGQRVTKDALKMPEDVAYNQAIENCMDAIRDLPDVSASTTGAAQTAEQVACKSEKCEGGRIYNTEHTRSVPCPYCPTPTHGSEAGE